MERSTSSPTARSCSARPFPSSAVTVKGLIDFRRLADDETDLVLAILVAVDLVLGVVLAFASGAGGAAGDTLATVAKAVAFIAAALAISKC